RRERPICFVSSSGHSLRRTRSTPQSGPPRFLASGPFSSPRRARSDGHAANDERHRAGDGHHDVALRVSQSYGSGEERLIHRECGVLKTTYEADMALYPLPIARYTVAAIAVLFFLVIPLTLHEYFLSVANLVWIAVIGALGLNILVGYTGLVSIGHGAFMSVGAYTAANLATRLDSPWPVNLVAGGLMAALVGAGVGIPSLRIKGLYLTIATLAGQLVIEWTINHVSVINGVLHAALEVARPRIGPYVLGSQRAMYYFLLF